MSPSVNRASGVDVALPGRSAARAGRGTHGGRTQGTAQGPGRKSSSSWGLDSSGSPWRPSSRIPKRISRSTKYVVGLQRASRRSYWKIQAVNEGTCPLRSEDEELGRMISRCVLEKRTLRATFVDSVLSQADVVVVDIQCDFLKKEIGNVAPTGP